MSAIERWKTQVKAHHAQSIRAMGGREPEDFWRRFASRFREDPRRTDDPVLNRLLQEVSPETTVLDVGGGGGRFALPLALRCRHVTAVEPSPSMIETLQEGAHQANLSNLTTVQETWEEVEIEPADVVLCAHVLYGVEEVEPFLRKLNSHALKRVLILMFMDFPQAHLSPFWERVHREKRIQLPGLRELQGVLWEMGIYPDLEMVHTFNPHAFETWEAAQEEFRRRLYVVPGTEQDRRLEQVMGELLEKAPEGFAIRGAPLRRLGLLSWRLE